ncbi:MAG: hypothetical protein E6772_10280 [Dysgonomonas sp.]|nr:hypothetical protein [Dysgonomonas sp.]
MSDRKYFNFPISTLLYDEIKPVLEAYFGLQESFINDVFIESFKELNESLPPEKKYSPRDMFRGMSEMRKQGYDLKFFVFDADKLYDLTVKYELHIAFYHSLIIMVSYYIRFFYAPNINEMENYNALEQHEYTNLIRPDMLKLYNFVNDWRKTPTDEPIIIACGSKKLKLDNKSNWIFTAINDYLKTYLKVDNVESAKEELETYNLKAGKKMNKYQSIFAFGIDNLYQDISGKEEITNEECCFIRDFLKYLGQPISQDEFDDPDDIKNIRSRLKYMRKTEFEPNWYSIDDSPVQGRYW